jgi:hypothetical protein
MPAAGTGRLRLVGDDRFGGEEQGGDRRCVLQRRAGDLGGVDDAELDEVLVVAGGGVEALGAAEVADPLDDDAALEAGVLGDLLERASSDLATMRAPVASSPCRPSASFRTAAWARSSATPPPGTTPSSMAALVVDTASSMRCFFSFSSTSVAAPTLSTATPPTAWRGAPGASPVVVGVGVLDLGLDLVDPALDVVLVPAPSTIVVSSLVTTIRLAGRAGRAWRSPASGRPPRRSPGRR